MDDNELNDAEMDDLLRELEQKADANIEKKSAPVAKPAPVAKKVRPNSNSLPKAAPTKSEIKEVKRETASNVSVVQRGSDASISKKFSFFVFLFILPFIWGAIWMLGNYLAAFISAAWLIALVASFAIITLPYVIKKIIKKGRYTLWAGLISLLLIVGMVFPSSFSTPRIIQYGHWPAAVFSEAIGWDANNILTQTAVSMSAQLTKVFPLIGLTVSGDFTSTIPWVLGKEEPLCFTDEICQPPASVPEPSVPEPSIPE